MSKKKLNDNQIKQINNIVDTLLEATDHLMSDIKERNKVQTINIFSAIVEGFQAIQKHFITYEHTSVELVNKIEKTLVTIMNFIEEDSYMKIVEVIQFSLKPNLRKLQESFDVKDNNSNITIGVFQDNINPKYVTPINRIKALNQEAKYQNVTLIFFASSDVDIENKEISADVYKNGKWTKIKSNFPDVIHNIHVQNKHQQSITERKLRRMIPFTSYYVGDKLSLPSQIIKYKKYADLLVPFKIVSSKRNVYDYLEKQNSVVIKPLYGARGENVYFLQRKGNRFTLTDNRIQRIYNKDKLDEWIEKILLRRKNSYMVQHYIHTRTLNYEPYDIRVHMQKNMENKWVITKMYPRIGSKKSILSNISRGGRTQNLLEFLIRENGMKQGENYFDELTNLSINFTEHLDWIYNFSLDELGLDLAIDETGRMWLHEVNNGPQTAYHEKERAINTIGYARFIAEKGIMKENQFSIDKNQFNAQNSNITFSDLDGTHNIGMLKSSDSEGDEQLAIACAYVAKYENVNFFTFSPIDVDYNEQLIKGCFYIDNEWVEKIVAYPDVVYDRLRMRGVEEYKEIYEELQDIPFNNQFNGNPISKIEVYDKLNSINELKDIIIPYKKVEKVKDIFDFLDKHQEVILKPEISSFAQGVYYISKINNNKYEVIDKNIKHEINTSALRESLKEFMSKAVLVIQKYISSRTIDNAPFDIRVHYMKDRYNKWSLVNLFPRIGVNQVASTGLLEGSYRGEFEGLINRNFVKQNSNNIRNNIIKITSNIADIFETFYEESFNEIAFDIALDKECNIFLFELNVNKPGILHYEFKIARLAISNAIYIADCHKEFIAF